MKKNALSNELRLILFCAAIGAVVGVVFWVFLFAVNKGTWLIWDLIPGRVLKFGWYPVLACTLGGLLTGLFRRKNGDYPEEMTVVFAKLKQNGTYPYRKILVLLVAALLPLIFGSSVGPEAGMVGIVVALCCWAGENLRFAGSQSAYYSRVGASVSLSVLFRSPLFGILDEMEDEAAGNAAEVGRQPVSRSAKIAVYSVATGAGFGAFWLMNTLLGKVSEGFPTFDIITLGAGDYALFILYLICGIALGLFFEISEKLFEGIGHSLPPVVGETIAGLILGVTASLLPVIRFSGEEQMGELIRDFALYAPLAMIGIAFLKIVMTNMCIHLGLKGGHFFPLIFAAVCMGYGIALLFFPGDAAHATFAAAVVAAATLGVTMKKPLAVSVLLLLCFPVRSLLWIVPAAAIAGWAGNRIAGGKEAQ